MPEKVTGFFSGGWVAVQPVAEMGRNCLAFHHKAIMSIIRINHHKLRLGEMPCK